MNICTICMWYNEKYCWQTDWCGHDSSGLPHKCGRPLSEQILMNNSISLFFKIIFFKSITPSIKTVIMPYAWLHYLWSLWSCHLHDHIICSSYRHNSHSTTYKRNKIWHPTLCEHLDSAKSAVQQRKSIYSNENKQLATRWDTTSTAPLQEVGLKALS